MNEEFEIILARSDTPNIVDTLQEAGIRTQCICSVPEHGVAFFSAPAWAVNACLKLTKASMDKKNIVRLLSMGKDNLELQAELAMLAMKK